jgi:hypothetical protein
MRYLVYVLAALGAVVLILAIGTVLVHYLA